MERRCLATYEEHFGLRGILLHSIFLFGWRVRSLCQLGHCCFSRMQSRNAIPRYRVINGINDPTNPYNGGISAKNKGLVRSTDDTFRYWATLDGYKGEPAMEALPDTDPSDGKTIEKYTYKQKGNPEITLLKVINGEHNNPKDIDVYLESWSFFKRQIGIK